MAERKQIQLEHEQIQNERGNPKQEEDAVADPQQNARLDWSWKREAAQSCRGKINSYSKFRVIADIRIELGACGSGVYAKFEQSCFGHFLGFDPDAYMCNTALHSLLAREIAVSNAGNSELWFRIGQQFVRFSKVEFCLITGLKFGDSTFNPNVRHEPPVDGVYRRYFGGQSVVVNDLWAQFKAGRFRDPPIDALKVAFVLLAEILLFGIDIRTTVRLWLWTLVEDFVQFDSFPWGKYTFQILLHYLIKGIHGPTTPGKRAQYHIYGFPMALQIWAYEVIPSLGSICARQVSQDKLPRCVRWKMPKKMLSLDNFFTPDLHCEMMIEATEEEQRKPYWQDIHSDIFDGIQYLHKENPFAPKTSTSMLTRRLSRSTFTCTRFKTMIDPPPKRRRTELNAPPAPAPSRPEVTHVAPPVHVSPPSPPPLGVTPPPGFAPPASVDPPSGPRRSGSYPVGGDSRVAYGPWPQSNGRLARASGNSAFLQRLRVRRASSSRLSRTATRTFLREEVPAIIDRALDGAVGRALDRALPSILRRELSFILPTILPDIVRQVVREEFPHFEQSLVDTDTDVSDPSTSSSFGV